MRLTAEVAAGQRAQLYADTVLPPQDATEARILAAHAAHFPPYLHCSTYLAGILAQIPDAYLDRIVTASVPASTAFQTQNDLHGFLELERHLNDGPDALTLANTSDVARRRRTTLMAAALQTLDGEDHRIVRTYLAGEDTLLEQIVRLIRASGAVEHCTALADRLSRNPAHSWTLIPPYPAMSAPPSTRPQLYLQARPEIIPVTR